MMQISNIFEVFRPKWGNILIVLISSILTGCAYSFDLKDSDMKPMLAVRAKICADSAVVIKVDKTVPLTQIGKVDTAMVSPQYSLKCNGVEVETTYEMDGEGGMIIKADSFKSGDKLDFTFSAEGMETVTTSTQIPSAFPKYTVTQANSGSLKIAYEDNPDEDNYYAAYVQWRGKVANYDYDGNLLPSQDIIDGPVYVAGNYDSLNLDPGAYSPVVVKHEGRSLYFWSDRDEEDNVYDLKFEYAYQGDHILDREVRCVLLNLSPQMYRTLFAQYDVESNPFSELGLSSPSFTYSNIRNGFGHFCGYSITPSQWIADPVNLEL